MNQDEMMTNPADRLRKILRKVNQLSLDKTGLEVWLEVFGVTNENKMYELMDVTLQLGALNRLFDKTILALQQIDNINEDLFIAPIKVLWQVLDWKSNPHGFAGYLVNSFDDNKRFVNSTGLTSLDFAEDALAKSGEFSEKVILKEEISAIINDLNNLY